MMCACGCGKETSGTSRTIKGHHNRLLEIKLKKIEASRKRYNTDNPFQSEEIKKICSETVIKNFGVDNASKSEIIKLKKRDTLQKNYNVDIPYQSEIIRHRGEDTLFKNFGVDNASKSEIIKIKKIDTCRKNHGTDYPGQSDLIKEKSKESNLKHSGFEHWSKTPKGRLFHSIRAIKRIEDQQVNNEPVMPCVGYNERPFLNELQLHTSNTIIRQDPNFRYIVGQFPDGHIKELKLFIQFDERDHFTDNTYNNYTELDIQKTLNLASLGYIVFRVSEKDWISDKEKVISDFKILVEELQ